MKYGNIVYKKILRSSIKYRFTRRIYCLLQNTNRVINKSNTNRIIETQISTKHLFQTFYIINYTVYEVNTFHA